MDIEKEHSVEVFKPAWDNWSIITTVVCLLIAGVLIGTALTYREPAYRVLLIVIAAALLAFVFTFPYRVTLLDRKLIKLSYVGHSKMIDLESYRLIASGREFAKGAWRLFASGGHFGYWGWWRLKDGRGFFSCLTNFSRHVRFLSDGKQIIALNAPKAWFTEPASEA